MSKRVAVYLEGGFGMSRISKSIPKARAEKLAARVQKANPDKRVEIR